MFTVIDTVDTRLLLISTGSEYISTVDGTLALEGLRLIYERRVLSDSDER